MASETIYDHPLYYDILFGWDRSREAEFYHSVLERSGAVVGDRVLEVGCGTGQVARRLGRRGWRIIGLDIRPGMLAFLRERAAEEGLCVETLCADMKAFSIVPKCAGAYNPMSSFRLLDDDAAARSHLDSVAAALQSRSVYVLDMDFLASEAELAVTTEESWEMVRGVVTVRSEDSGVYVNDDGVEHTLAWGREAHLRGYTAAAFSQLVGATAFRIESWHPESSRATGVSEFRVDETSASPVSGRAMVVLRRRS